MDKHEWRPVPGLEDQLEVSRCGKVRGKDYLAPSTRKGQPTQLRKGLILTPWVGRNGYLVIAVQRNGKRVKHLVHRLVALAFVPGWFEDATVDHLDFNRLNNCAENLEWVTRSENTKRQLRAGRGAPIGEAHSGAKLRDEDVPVIFYLLKRGALVSDIANVFGVSVSLIYKLRDGKRRKALPIAA